MRILWLCNLILPAIAQELGLEASNKEGWIAGLAHLMLRHQGENQVELAVAAPVPGHLLQGKGSVLRREVTVEGGRLVFYGFGEDTDHPHLYDESLEESMRQIFREFEPQMIHCFGTEYPHTLAACRAFPEKEKILITIQGLCAPYAEAYLADLPEIVIKRETFRDRLKKDGILAQKEKFRLRGVMEKEAVSLAGNLGGRTAWDLHYAKEWNPSARYFVMKETLRSNFYEGLWSKENCEAHSIFLSQGDYPIKGLHYVLKALPTVLRQYGDAKVYLAGNRITAHKTWKEKLKLSSYGKYLLELIRQAHLEDKVVFLGRLTSAQMKEQYLKSSVFVCPSSIENSPNSLGEAMLLGMPCVTADVGGVLSIFTDGEDGIAYPGFRVNGEGLEKTSEHLANAIIKLWSDPEKEKEYCKNAREHALRNHDQAKNYERTLEVYAMIIGGSEENGSRNEA